MFVPSDDFESKLAQIADCLNQELRESNGDKFQIEDYLHTDFRPAIRKLVDLNRARPNGIERTQYEIAKVKLFGLKYQE